jgi:hypothetical protein
MDERKKDRAYFTLPSGREKGTGTGTGNGRRKVLVLVPSGWDSFELQVPAENGMRVRVRMRVRVKVRVIG